MRNIVFVKGNFIVVDNKIYYTVVNIKPKGNKNKHIYHCHVDKNNLNSARMIAVWANKLYNDNTLSIPDRYPDFMKNRINRVLNGRE